MDWSCEADFGAEDESTGPAEPGSGDSGASTSGAGLNDWGGVSPITVDFINPEAPWPALRELRLRTRGCRASTPGATPRVPGIRSGST